jgi:putative flippase GtrA
MKKGDFFVFLRYLGVGVINTVVGLTSILVLFNLFQLNYWFATSIGNIFGVIVSFFLNKRYTFKYKGNKGYSLLKFLLVSLISYIISYSLGYYIGNSIEHFVPHIDIFDNLVIVFSSGIYTILGFFGHKKITFSEKSLGDL